MPETRIALAVFESATQDQVEFITKKLQAGTRMGLQSMTGVIDLKSGHTFEPQQGSGAGFSGSASINRSSSSLRARLSACWPQLLKGHLLPHNQSLHADRNWRCLIYSPNRLSVRRPLSHRLPLKPMPIKPAQSKKEAQNAASNAQNAADRAAQSAADAAKIVSSTAHRSTRSKRRALASHPKASREILPPSPLKKQACYATNLY